VAPCARCGTFLCGACLELRGEAAWCEDCLAWLRKNGPPSRAVQVFIALGLAGVLGTPLCGALAPVLNLFVAVPGLLLTTRELRRIRQGEGPLRGVLQAKVARVLAGLNLGLVLLWGAIIVYLWVGRRG
jgi:hypothetical protein